MAELDSSRIFFHLGLPRTGSTTLQHVLEADRRVNLIRNRRLGRTADWKRALDSWREESVNVLSEENLVLASQGLVPLPVTLGRIRRLTPRAEIIITLREQRAFLVSKYKTNFLHPSGFHKSLESWLEDPQGRDYLGLAHYGTLYRTLRAFFPQDRVHLLWFEQLREEPGSFFETFYGILGMAPPSDFDPAVRKNASWPDAMLSMMKKWNRFKVWRGEHYLATRERDLLLKLSGYLKGDPSDPSLRWGEAPVFRKLEEDFGRENGELAREASLDLSFFKKYNYLLHA